MQDISWKQTVLLLAVGAVFGALFMHTIGHQSIAASVIDDHNHNEGVELEIHH